MRQNFSFLFWLWLISNAEELIFISCKGNTEPRGGHNWSSLSPERPKLLLGLEVELRMWVQELLWREGKIQGYWDAVTDFKEQLVFLLSPPTSPGLFVYSLGGVWEESTWCLNKGKGKKVQTNSAKHPGNILGSISCWSSTLVKCPVRDSWSTEISLWETGVSFRG